MINKILFASLILAFTTQISNAQVSPWGTGTVNNQSLNPIIGKSLYNSHTSDIISKTFDLNSYLANYSYNIYIPKNYDGTEPYGLITFINSGNNGAIINSWITVLEEKNIILISGNNIGNSAAILDRMGVALAGSERLKEVLNIDTTRVYASGNSGGARSCAAMISFFPEKFQGAVPNCGSSYLRKVDQDYETHQANSHYEYGAIQYNANHLAYVKSFDIKHAMMTSFDDFREGDIMNIYHNGMEPDGFKSKIIEIAGGHCATSEQQFRDAINFVEHPHINVVVDSFSSQPIIGNGFKLEDVTISNKQLVFNHNASNVARAYSKDPFLWNDDKGAIVQFSLDLDSITYNKNSYFNIGLLDMVNPAVYNENVGHELYNSTPNLLVNLVFDAVQPTVNILAENPDAGISNDTLFSGKFSDWSSDSSLEIKYHVWNQQIKIEFEKHINTISKINSFTKLLDDKRSVRIRTNNNYWANTDFNTGTLLTFVSGKLDTLSISTPIKLNFLEVIAADTLTGNIINSTAEASKHNFGDNFIVYPNPTNGEFSIDLGENYNSTALTIKDLSGRVIQTKTYNKEKLINLKLEEPAGIYLLTIKSENKKTIIRLIKE